MINILISCENTYIFPASVLCKSLVKNNGELAIHVFEYRMTEDNKEKLRKAVEPVGKVYFYDVDISVFGNLIIPRELNGHLSIEAYFRLLLLKYIPVYIEKILYLDTDIICNLNISDIYNMDLGPNMVGACKERGFNFEPRIKKRVYDNLGFDLEKDDYFNSGVILFDLKKIRNCYQENDFVDWLLDNQEKALLHDQDVLNYMFKGKVKWLPAYMNVRPFHYFYSKKMKRIISNKARIIHFGEKPWKNPHTWCGEFFWDYVDDKNCEHINVRTIQNRVDFYYNLKHNLKIFMYQKDRDIEKA